MVICPHCHAKSIPVLAKLWSGSADPLACSRCGGWSFVRSMFFGFYALLQLLLTVAAVSAFLLWHWWPLAVFLLLVAGWVAWLALWAPLVPISADRARIHRRDGRLALVAFLFVVIAVALLAR